MSKKSTSLTLSLIIPVCNEQNYIRACLNSIEQQTVLPDEVIVVDNNCSDKTVDIAREYKFVKVIREKRQGIVYARNTGFDAAKSELIGRIDADTNINSLWVESAKNLAVNATEQTAFTGPCKFRDWHGKMLLFWGHRLIFFWSSYLFLGHHTLFGSNMFLRRSLWQKLKNKTCLRNDIHEDMDLSIHIQNLDGRVVFSRKLKATISPRRIFRMFHYPKMWVKTKLVNHQFLL